MKKIKQVLAITGLVVSALVAAPVTSFADEDDKVDMASVVLNMQDAITIALDQVPGTVVEAELEAEDDKAVWEISVMGENDQVSEVEIDANTGVVLEVEVDDD